MNDNTYIKVGTRLIGAGVLLACGVALTGCRGERTNEPPRQFLPDMDDSPKWKPQVGSDFFVDGRSMRPRVDHTVGFGVVSNASDPRRERFLRDNEAYYFGTSGVLASGEPNFVDTIPLGAFPDWPTGAPATEEAFGKLIERGRERFTIYCAACHGPRGDGKGEVGVRWAGAVANFHEAKFVDRKERTGKDGYIFYAARNGVWDRNGQRVLDGNPHITSTESAPADKQLMPPYGHAVDEHDAWAIVAYVRVLQALRTTNLNEVPEAELDRLRKNAPPPPPPPPTPIAPTTTTPSTPAAPGGASPGATGAPAGGSNP
ncbi:MAG: cytochrome c [Phycisphaerales bacterium]